MHDPAFYNLGYAHHRNGQLDQAIHSYKIAIELNKNSAESHFNLASAYNDNGNEKEAIESYK